MLDESHQALLHALRRAIHPIRTRLGIGADTFLRDLRHRITAKQMLFFIDACHAAAVYTEHGVAVRSTDNIIPAVRAVWEQELSHTQELNMGFLSAAANQVSMEDGHLSTAYSPGFGAGPEWRGGRGWR